MAGVSAPKVTAASIWCLERKRECHLGTDSLHMLDWSVEESVFQEAKVKLDEIGSPSKFFKRQSKMAKIL
jgi:hypothetical protein